MLTRDESAMSAYTRATTTAHEAYVATTTLAWEHYQRATAEAWDRYLAQIAAEANGDAMAPGGDDTACTPDIRSGAQPPPSPGQAPASSVRESQGAAATPPVTSPGLPPGVAVGVRPQPPGLLPGDAVGVRPQPPGLPPNPEHRDGVGLPHEAWHAAVELLSAAADGRALETTFRTVWARCRDALTEAQRDALLEFHDRLRIFHSADG